MLMARLIPLLSKVDEQNLQLKTIVEKFKIQKLAGIITTFVNM